MRKPCGKLHKIPAVGLAVLLLCCTPTAGCGKYEQTAPLPEQTGALPESTESSESAALSEAMEPAEEAAPEDQEGAFCFDPDLANFVYSGKMIFVNEDQAREQGRGILTLQLSFLDSRMKNCVDYFNSHNDDYYIAIQEIGYGEELKTCREHTLVELNAGRGPDIFEGDTFLTVTQSILDKGVLMDLAPLLDGLGITDEKYFPQTALWRTERMYTGFPLMCVRTPTVSWNPCWAAGNSRTLKPWWIGFTAIRTRLPCGGRARLIIWCWIIC